MLVSYASLSHCSLASFSLIKSLSSVNLSSDVQVAGSCNRRRLFARTSAEGPQESREENAIKKTIKKTVQKKRMTTLSTVPSRAMLALMLMLLVNRRRMDDEIQRAGGGFKDVCTRLVGDALADGVVCRP